ncbi:hypothetical protein B0T26DRAFT_679619 [Lasiosphaeria miniovina]|uniref:Uncharacterized protein n=1 Tax=Lasiosphaeria miniovina TaxID=1954250 RepID=A0AA40DP14_9PEZI|nr:uncharacterized protein B0T26DRAFT_679619 [Lasiosphaeria miniovina]KAK0710330.1 hypothetical protein B0T26DRAFT_679619 [Lasiosphaeria miniovina]
MARLGDRPWLAPRVPTSASASATSGSAPKDANGGKQPKLCSTCDSCQDAKVRCSHESRQCRRYLDSFDIDFGSPECVDFGSSSSGSRVRSDSSFSFAGLSMWDQTEPLDERVAFAYPTSLVLASAHSIFPGDLTAEHGTDRIFALGVIDPTLDFHSPQSGPPHQHQEQQPLKGRRFTEPDATEPGASIESEPRPENRTFTCYASILAELSQLDKNKTDGQVSTIDTVLRVKPGVQQHATKVFSCEMCTGNRSGLLLLLVMVIDHVVRVLGKISSSARPVPPSPQREVTCDRNSNHNKDDGNGDRTLSPRAKPGSHGQRGGALVGSLGEVVGHEKIDFLKLLVQGRLGSNYLESFRDSTANSGQRG